MRTAVPEQRGGIMGLLGRAYDAGIPQALTRFGGALMAGAGPSRTPVNPWGPALQELGASFENVGQRQQREAQAEEELLRRRQERAIEAATEMATRGPRTLTIPSPEGRFPAAFNPDTGAYERIVEGEPISGFAEGIGQLARMMASEDPRLAEVYARRYEELTGRPAAEVLMTM
jgi:hypothetical protein